MTEQHTLEDWTSKIPMTPDQLLRRLDGRVSEGPESDRWIRWEREAIRAALHYAAENERLTNLMGKDLIEENLRLREGLRNIRAIARVILYEGG